MVPLRGAASATAGVKAKASAASATPESRCLNVWHIATEVFRYIKGSPVTLQLAAESTSAGKSYTISTGYVTNLIWNVNYRETVQPCAATRSALLCNLLRALK